MTYEGQTCTKCGYAECLTGTYEFQAACAKRAAANRRLDEQMVMVRGAQPAKQHDPRDLLDEAVRQLRAANRKLERYQHGLIIEGDDVCPNELRINKLLAEMDGIEKRLTAELDTARAEVERLRDALIVSQNNESRLRLRLDGVHPSHMPTVIDGLETERDAARAEAEQLRAERDALASNVAFHADGAFAIIRDRTADAIAAHLERFSDYENDDDGDAAAHAVAFCCDQIRSGAWRTTKGDAGK